MQPAHFWDRGRFELCFDDLDILNRLDKLSLVVEEESDLQRTQSANIIIVRRNQFDMNCKSRVAGTNNEFGAIGNYHSAKGIWTLILYVRYAVLFSCSEMCSERS